MYLILHTKTVECHIAVSINMMYRLSGRIREWHNFQNKRSLRYYSSWNHHLNGTAFRWLWKNPGGNFFGEVLGGNISRGVSIMPPVTHTQPPEMTQKVASFASCQQNVKWDCRNAAKTISLTLVIRLLGSLTLADDGIKRFLKNGELVKYFLWHWELSRLIQVFAGRYSKLFAKITKCRPLGDPGAHASNVRILGVPFTIIESKRNNKFRTSDLELSKIFSRLIQFGIFFFTSVFDLHMCVVVHYFNITNCRCDQMWSYKRGYWSARRAHIRVHLFSDPVQ